MLGYNQRLIIFILNLILDPNPHNNNPTSRPDIPINDDPTPDETCQDALSDECQVKKHLCLNRVI